MTAPDRNPQAREMADESMVRNLRAQAIAIWPQEFALFTRYQLPNDARILDIGCGTGEVSYRLAESFPTAHVTGGDVIEAHLNTARDRCREFADRTTFQIEDAFNLSFDDNTFDLVVNRHMLQAVPDADQVVAELYRVTKPSGRLHILAEDYAMMYFHPTELDSDAFWRDGPVAYGTATGTDLLSGRKVPNWLHAQGATDVWVDYIVVDTLRVDPEVFANIWEAWRDGYSNTIAENTRFSRDEVHAHWEDMIACIRTPESYACWQIPVISATKG